MSVLILTRGLPASGKSTRARAWVAETEAGEVVHRVLSAPRSDRLPTRARCNRDDLRTMLFGGWTGVDAHEAAVSLAQHTAVTALLRAGVDVVCDDTNLHPGTMAAWAKLAADVGAEIEVWDLTGVSLEVCLHRNELRAGTPAYVPPAVIRDMAARHLGTMALDR